MEGYNLIAPFYGVLERIWFGHILQAARIAFIDHIPKNARILIIGGGLGNELPIINDHHPQCTIDFVDSSDNMIKFAKSNRQDQLFVNYYHSLEEVIDHRYEFILLHFFLDQFTNQTLTNIVRQVATMLVDRGHISVVDFAETSIPLNKVQIWLMYRFFRIIAHIEAKYLPNYNNVLASQGFINLDKATYMQGMIQSSLFQKNQSGNFMNSKILSYVGL